MDYRSWASRYHEPCTVSNREAPKGSQPWFSFGDSNSCTVLFALKYIHYNKPLYDKQKRYLVPALPRPVRVHCGLCDKPKAKFTRQQCTRKIMKLLQNTFGTVHAFVQRRVTALLWFDFLTLLEMLCFSETNV